MLPAVFSCREISHCPSPPFQSILHPYLAVNFFTVSEDMVVRENLVCPKPIRVGQLCSTAADCLRTHRWTLSNQTEVFESSAREDLLDILLVKGGGHGLLPFGTEVDSSPPFFSGSPPSRVFNPLIKDPRFYEERHSSSVLPQLQSSITRLSSPQSSFTSKGGYSSASFGNNPTVRIEGFACMEMNGHNGAVSARA